MTVKMATKGLIAHGKELVVLLMVMTKYLKIATSEERVIFGKLRE